MIRTQSRTVQVRVVQIHRTILVFVKMDNQVVVRTVCAQDSGLQFVNAAFLCKHYSYSSWSQMMPSTGSDPTKVGHRCG